ncbi:zinc ribbon domain-containing protein [Bacillus suaedaesalsae]|uniref:Zinc ribbon domain-containing protein n=1 Tax=Bacillus suaedaesalsae TaxID=2810349 RepID=A0ABS2DJU9_9BACI|nr:zinc ribbon domain-containing protein [Bacillus suaedaesalsae]MBM6618775.1 zinc ribbon domain-containing protein [Bacillus suaedaesalsae]
MKSDKFITDEHVKTRTLFRFLGPVVFIGGLLCMIIAFIDFFSLQPFEEPEKFWLFFVGMPVSFVGFILTGFGYGSTVAKYQAREYAPVAKDTFNYLAKETSEGLSVISKSVKQDPSLQQHVTCPRCQNQNAATSNFCDECGTSLVQACKSCNHVNDHDARFCTNCGTKL